MAIHEEYLAYYTKISHPFQSVSTPFIIQPFELYGHYLWSSLFYLTVHPYAAPPVITTLRPLQDTVRQRENAIFSCKAEGYPLPTISWKHNGMIVTDGHPDYLISQKNEGSSRVASDLRIFSVSVDKTGDVTCIATANTPEESRITFADHNASTSLTVLGMFFTISFLPPPPTIQLPVVFPSPHNHYS